MSAREEMGEIQARVAAALIKLRMATNLAKQYNDKLAVARAEFEATRRAEVAFIESTLREEGAEEAEVFPAHGRCPTCSKWVERKEARNSKYCSPECDPVPLRQGIYLGSDYDPDGTQFQYTPEEKS